MSSHTTSSASANGSGGKRRRLESSTAAASSSVSFDTLTDVVETLKKEASDFETRSKSHISKLVQKFEELEKACKDQISIMKRDLAAKDSQVQSLSRNVERLQTNNAAVENRLRVASGSRDAWREKHESVYKSNTSLRKETHEAKEKQQLAEERLEPYSTRLEEYREIGQRINDNIIRRVIRLKQIDDIRNAKGGKNLNDAQKKELETEAKDQLFILMKAWEMIAEDYEEMTNGGSFDQEDK